MKCPNCGADLEINKEKELRFCPYCGHKVEMKEETPTTMAGAVSGIAKDILKQKAEREKYEREHADELEARERRKQKEASRRGFLGLLPLLLFFFALLILGKYLGS